MVQGAVTLQAGTSITIIVAAAGDNVGDQSGGGGGGLSAVYTNGPTVAPTIVADDYPHLTPHWC